jgi:hypothetical protein
MKKTHRILSLVFVFAVCLLVLAPAAKADTAIYNNFNPLTNPTFDDSTYPWWIEYGNGDTAAMPFTVGANGNYNLTQIILALGWNDGQDNFTVALNADSSGPYGSLLETWNVTTAPLWSGSGDSYTPDTLISSGGVVLDAGQTYWISITADGSDTTGVWNLNQADTSGTVWSGNQYGTSIHTGTTGAFEVLGDPVAAPEPGSMTLLGLGLGVLGIFRRRKTA